MRPSRARVAAAPVGALQRWFQRMVMDPGRERGAVISRSGAVELLLQPSRELTARERLAVYADSYFLRLRDVMKVDFPGVLHALGERAFAGVVREYVTVHPSTSFTLNDLGARFPRFIEKEATANEVARRRLFLAELATLERAVEDVFHERHAPSVDVARLRSIPMERWSDARFTLIPAVRLLAFNHPVDPYLQDVLDGKRPRAPRARSSWVVVYRKEWRSWRARLSIEQHRILEALSRGRPLGAALRHALAAPGSDAERTVARLHEWFREWTAEGLFAAIAVGRIR